MQCAVCQMMLVGRCRCVDAHLSGVEEAGFEHAAGGLMLYVCKRELSLQYLPEHVNSVCSYRLPGAAVLRKCHLNIQLG